MSNVVVQMLALEHAAEEHFRQRSVVCRIRGVGDHKWREDGPR